MQRLIICAEKFAKLLGETEIECILRRLVRLTQPEAEGQMTIAQTLEIVHGFVNNVRVVINGTQRSSVSGRSSQVTLS